MQLIERELKLVPASAELLDQLAALSELGPFRVTARRRELQRNSFFDTRQQSLRLARLAFRRRTFEGQPLATWTLKAGGSHARAVLARLEIELELQPDMPPSLALVTLGQAAQHRGAAEIAEHVEEALADGAWDLPEPYLEFVTDRQVRDLRADQPGWEVELALDRLRLPGHVYAEEEIEVELHRGEDAALDAAREAIDAVGSVQPSRGSKLSRCLEHLAHCTCASAPGAQGSTESIG